MSRLEASCFPVTGSHSLLCRERTEVWPSWGCCAELHEAVRVARPARPADHGARLRLTSASPDPPCRSPGSETKSVSSPDPARGWFQLCPPGLADTLGCTLHLGSVSRTARASAATTRCHAPTWWQAHMKQRGAQGQMGLGLHCVCGRGGGGSHKPCQRYPPPTLGQPGRVLPANLSGDCPCLRLTASQLLACRPIISVYVCRWPGPLCRLCCLARTGGILGGL